MKSKKARNLSAEEIKELKKERIYPVDVMYGGEVIGSMNKRGEVIVNDFKYTSTILKGLDDHLGIFEVDSNGNFLKNHVEIRKLPKNN